MNRERNIHREKEICKVELNLLFSLFFIIGTLSFFVVSTPVYGLAVPDAAGKATTTWAYLKPQL